MSEDMEIPQDNTQEKFDSEDEDWDAEVGDQKAPQLPAASAELYHMQSSGNMTTITPAGAKSKFTKAQPMPVTIEWVKRGGHVTVSTSFDDFDKAFELEEVEQDGHKIFRGTLQLPPGRYLFRYCVDGDYAVDDDREVVCSLGNEYNAITVTDAQDEEEEEEEEEEDDDDDDDELVEEEDWGELDEKLPEHIPKSRSILEGLDASKGMVTITPEMARGAEKFEEALSHDEKKLLHGTRGGSLQWDATRQAFVIASPDKPHVKRAPSAIAAAVAAANANAANTAATDRAISAAASKSTGDTDARLEKERQKRRQKKKRQKEKRRENMSKNRFAFAAASLKTSGSSSARRESSNAADIAAIKEEVVRREREWREAWILHEMKAQEMREKEKSALRQQFKEEREQWILKIKHYTHDNNQLHQQVLEFKTKLESAQSDTSVSENAVKRARQQFEEDRSRLISDAEQSRAESVDLKEQVKSLRADKDALQKSYDESKSAWRKEEDEIRSERSNLKLSLEASQRELAYTQEEKRKIEQELTQKLKEQVAEHSRALEDAKRDISLKTSELTKNAEEAKEAIQSALNNRIEELRAQVAEKSKVLDEVRAQLSATERSLSESKLQSADQQSRLDALKAELHTSNNNLSASNEQIQSLTARIEALNKERAQKENDFEKKIADLEGKETNVRNQLQEKQAALETALSHLDKSKSELKVAEAAWERSKADYERQLSVLQASRDQFNSKILQVANHTSPMRDALKVFKDNALIDMAKMRAELEDGKKFLIQSIQAQAEMLATTMKRYKKELSERRKYFNLVQELRGNIRVFCRVRPYLPSDDKWAGNRDVATYPEENVVKISTEKRDNEYEFDCVFPSVTSNEQIFAETAPLVQSVMDGYNVCIFAYGQTGSGKTHTMVGYGDDRGVMYRALSELFRLRDERKEEFAFNITVNMLEIYNEKIRDLLDASPGAAEKEPKIHRGPNGVYVDNLVEREVNNEEDVLACMRMGEKNRSVGITNMNEHSSRSHSLLSVKVIAQNLTAGITYYGKLHLIDLAGSERVSRSGATGDRLKEAQAINKSLSALGNVIEALQKKNSHVPYRDSKLTFLLQDSLGGHAKTLMFINVSPALEDSDETFCSLNFADRTRKVELGAATKTVVSSGDAATAVAAAAPAASPTNVTPTTSSTPARTSAATPVKARTTTTTSTTSRVGVTGVKKTTK